MEKGMISVPPPFSPPKGSFQKELECLINRHSIEGGSNTPDFILAEYLRCCLDSFDMVTRRRDEWFDYDQACNQVNRPDSNDTEKSKDVFIGNVSGDLNIEL